MFARALVIRNTLKRFMKANTLACITIDNEEEPLVVKINRVGLFTADIDYIDGDMQTPIQTGTIFIGDLKSVRNLSTYMYRILLLNSNPDLLLEDSLDYMGHDCEYVDTDED